MEVETEETTIERVRRVIANEMMMKVENLSATEEVTDNSIEQIAIGMLLEEEFGLDNFDDDKVMACMTVDDYVALVEGATAAQRVAP